MCTAEFLYIYTYEDTPENYYEDVSLNQDIHYAIHTSSPSCMKKCTKLPGVPVGFHYTWIFLHAYGNTHCTCQLSVCNIKIVVWGSGEVVEGGCCYDQGYTHSIIIYYQVVLLIMGWKFVTGDFKFIFNMYTINYDCRNGNGHSRMTEDKTPFADIGRYVCLH